MNSGGGNTASATSSASEKEKTPAIRLTRAPYGSYGARRTVRRFRACQYPIVS